MSTDPRVLLPEKIAAGRGHLVDQAMIGEKGRETLITLRVQALRPEREEGDADGVRDDVERHHGEDGAGGLVRDRDVAGVTRVSPI